MYCASNLVVPHLYKEVMYQTSIGGLRVFLHAGVYVSRTTAGLEPVPRALVLRALFRFNSPSN